jgi:nuclear transport factor 2 (NTF2) superfamily protein
MPRGQRLTADELLAWIAAHDAAWRSNDPEAIGRLFSEDAIYRLGPWEGPWRGYTGPIVGREAIVDLWTSTFDPDERFKADVDVVAIDGRRGVVQRKISYESVAGHPATRYGVLWVVDFDAAGQCREYQEWYVEKPKLGRESAS